MADENDEDLVSNVVVEGVDEATQKLNEYGDAGSKAFDKISKSADNASKQSQKASSVLGQQAQDTANSAEQMAAAQKKAEAAATQFARSAGAAGRQFGQDIRRTAQSLTQFAKRVATVVSGAGAAGAALLVMAGNAAKAADQTTSSFERSVQAQKDAIQDNLESARTADNFAAQQRQLNRQLADGTITYDQYSKSMDDNRAAYKEQIRSTEELRIAQEDAQRQTEALDKQLSDRKATQALEDRFGGTLTSSILTMGRAVNSIRQDFVDSFGPVVAQLVDRITDVLQRNGAAIGQFFSSASQKLQDFVQGNGPAIQETISNIGSGIAAVFTGLINAAPQLMNIFNNGIVPAIKAVASAAASITSALNWLFGTQFSTGTAVVIAALASMTSGFKLLFSAVGLLTSSLRVLFFLFTSNPIVGIITGVIVAITLLYQNWDTVTAFIASSWSKIVSLLSSGASSIAEYLTPVAKSIQDAFDSAIQYVVDAWNGFLNFLSGLPDTIGGIFTSIGESILSAFNSALDAVKKYVTDWVVYLKKQFQPILDIIRSISGETSGGSDGAQAFSGGGRVRGAGTSTSDSIPAWLSNNEFVIQAKAVRKYGASFLKAINSGRFNFDGIRKFATGGLVSSSVSPGLRFGGVPVPVGGGSSGGTLNLTIDGQSFEGLRIPDRETADALTRYAVQRRMSSGGKSPAWATPRR